MRIKQFCKCEKCGYGQTIVDDSEVLTSLPAKYKYTCPECGHIGYVVCSDTTLETDTIDKE